MPDVTVSEVKVPATDGYEFAATLYRSSQPAAMTPAVLIASATGVKRNYYDRYARFLAENGFNALSFDYRGIGGSRPRDLRGFPASMEDWAQKDLGGAIDWISTELKPHRLFAVGHSVGGQLVGLTPKNKRFDAMLAVAAQSGYWGHWPAPRRYFMYFLWHALMPGATKALSYFPAKKLGISEDLPGGVALQWAHWGRNPEYIVDEQGKPIREDFRGFTRPILSYSFSDDIFAPRAAVESLIQCYENAPKELKNLQPKDLEKSSIGHFGFFRDQFRSSLWTETTEWLKKQTTLEHGSQPGSAVR